MKNKVVIFWFRRDLRIEDNTALHHSLNFGFPVLPVFIFDTEILEKLEDKKDRRVDYFHQALTAINSELKKYESKIHTFLGKPFDVFQSLSKKFDIRSVFFNRDYEPKSIKRDTIVYNYFKCQNILVKAYKDQVIFDKNDIIKKDKTPYTVYTPYAKKWRSGLDTISYSPLKMNFNNLFHQHFSEIHSLEKIGFKKTDIVFEQPSLNTLTIDCYQKYRDYPALDKTTRLGTALRFGTISIRKCVFFALKHNEIWLSELIWREFFMQILYHFPNVVNQSFKKQYDSIQWRNNEKEFQLWCEGRTGYPIVDAGMRQLNLTGYMHNRIRMVAASFLCKHLLIDWRWGEAYFAKKLNDYDLSSNNGNWQWVSGSGCDSVPYFRIFNPVSQVQKFDKNLDYVKKWIPEFKYISYLVPIVDHLVARKRALSAYGVALK